MQSVRPPVFLRALCLSSLCLCVLTLGFAGHYTAGWYEVRRGKPRWDQRTSVGGVPWFKRPFVSFVHRLQRTIPAGSRVLLEPSRGREDSGKARWFLFLNYYADDLELYVRKPHWASGTLVDYPRWLDHHYVTLARPEAVDLRLSELIEIDKRGIDWKIRFPSTEAFAIEDIEIYRREESQWVPVPLAERARPTAADEPAPALEDA